MCTLGSNRCNGDLQVSNVAKHGTTLSRLGMVSIVVSIQNGFLPYWASNRLADRAECLGFPATCGS